MTKEETSPMSRSKSKKLGLFKRGNHWPLIIVGMLVVHASIILGTIMVVNARHDLYVEPDYYAKSVDWDAQRAIYEMANKMGWTIGLELSDRNNAGVSTGEPTRTLLLDLKDRNGDPLERALVELEYYHPANANVRDPQVLLDLGNGLYQATVTMNEPGFWNAHVSIRFQGMQAIVVREVVID